MASKIIMALAALAATLAFQLATPTEAAERSEAATAAKQIQTDWEAIKFTIPEGRQQNARMDALGTVADQLAAKYPDQPEALIWDGIVTSERASLAGPLSALGLAKRARDILEKAYQMDPATLDAGATTSLGVLYYRVPGFPIGFGDKAKARQLLEKAVKLAPNGLDAWYFYADFLLDQGDYAGAVTAFNHAKAIPEHAERPLWEKNRRLVIDEKLELAQSKLAKS